MILADRFGCGGYCYVKVLRDIGSCATSLLLLRVPTALRVQFLFFGIFFHEAGRAPRRRRLAYLKYVQQESMNFECVPCVRACFSPLPR